MKKTKPKYLDRITTRTFISRKTKMRLFPFPPLLFSTYCNASLCACFILLKINPTLSIIFCITLTHFNTNQWPGLKPLIYTIWPFHSLDIKTTRILLRKNLCKTHTSLKKMSTWLPQLSSASQETFP